MRAGACLFLAAAVAFSCHRGPKPLARVGNRIVTVPQVEEYLRSQTGREPNALSPPLAHRLVELYLYEEVLLASGQEAAPTTLSPEARSALVRERLAVLCPPPPLPSDQDLAALDALQPGEKAEGERVLLRQLVLPDAAAARSARERILRNEDFEEISRTLSRAPNAATGGMLGWVERGQLPPEFEAAVSSLPVGGVSAPVPSDAGWHVFQVLDRRSGTEFHQARQRARLTLAARHSDSAQRACLFRLAAALPIHVDCRHATFPCRNPFPEKP